MKRKLAWVCLLVLLLVIGGAFLLLPRDSITQANCDRIKPGMTVEEVESILGRKEDRNWEEHCIQIYLWEGSRGYIRVSMQMQLDLKLFTDSDQPRDPLLVSRARFYPSNSKTILEKATSWLSF